MEAPVDYGGVDTVYFVPCHQGVWSGGEVGCELLHADAAMDLFEAAYLVALGFKPVDGLAGGDVIFPLYGVFGTEGSLVDFRAWRSGADTAQHDAFDCEGVAGAEYRSDVVERPYVVEYYGQWYFGSFLELGHGEASHFGDFFLLHYCGSGLPLLPGRCAPAGEVEGVMG